MRAIVFLVLSLHFVMPCYADEVQDNKKHIGSYLKLLARTSDVRGFPEDDQRFINEEQKAKIIDSVHLNGRPGLVVKNPNGTKYFVPNTYFANSPSLLLTPEKTLIPTKDHKNLKQHVGKNVWVISKVVASWNVTDSRDDSLNIHDKYKVVGVDNYNCTGGEIIDLCVALKDKDNKLQYIAYRLFNEYTITFKEPPKPKAIATPVYQGQRAIKKKVSGRIRVGMTTDQVINAWGRPEDINSTISRYGTSEQWVYGAGNYVYFENGVLTTIQTSR